MNSQPVAVIGAGIGGLVAAVLLAGRGVETVVLERSGTPGGKMREAEVDGARIDCGPTVFTMRWVFDDIFGAIGEQLDNHISLRKTELLARHAWGPGEQLDLFADPQRSADAIGIFAGTAEARRYLDFCARARGVYQTLVSSFIRAPAPSVGSLIKHAGIRGLAGLARIRSVREPVVRSGRIFSRSTAAPAVRALCHLLRFIPVSGTRHADAGRACGTGWRLARGRWHASRCGGARGACRKARRSDPLQYRSIRNQPRRRACARR